MLDYVAGIFDISGVWVIGNKNKYGFLLTMLGNILWVAVAFKTGVFGLLIVVVPAIFVNIRNFIKWSKRKKRIRKLLIEI